LNSATEGASGGRAGLTRYALLGLGIAGLSMAGVLYKLTSAPIVAVVAYRMILAVAMVLPLVYLSRRSTDAQRQSPVARSDIGAAAASGTLFALDVTLWALSIQFTSVSSAALLVSMDPIFVAVFAAIIFGERPSWQMVVGMVIAAGGAAVITVGDFHISGRALIGDALALAAAFAETGY